MSNGVIDYALGLETTGLLGKLTGVNQAFDLLGKVIDGVGAIGGRVFQEIERGAALNDLSNRTGETVGNLYQLQFAFEQAGISAGNVPGTILRLQKSLSGVGEMGENTAESFAAMGLNIEELRNLDTPAAFQKIFDGLNKLDRNSAADVASRIFGRGSSGDMLQLARDSEGFAEALADAAQKAAILQRNAAAFDKLGDTFNRIQQELSTVFAIIAQDITPALQVMLDLLKGHEWDTIGKLLELSLKSGIQGASNFMLDTLDLWSAKIKEVLGQVSDKATSGGFWETVGKGGIGIGSGLLSLPALLGGALKVPGAQELGENLVEFADKMFGDIGFNGVISSMAEQLASGQAGARSNPFFDELQRFFADRISQPGEPAPRGPGKTPNNLFGGFSTGSAFGDANALERVGASFGGGSSNVQNRQLKVQERIAKSADQLIKEVKAMDRRFDIFNQ